MGTVTARWVAVAATIVAAAFSVSACSPERVANVALLLEDGQPTALLHHCGDHPVGRLSVTDLTTPSAPDPDAVSPTTLYVPWWSVRSGDGVARPDDVRLLRTPAGWTLDSGNPFPIEEIRDGYDYELRTDDPGFPGLRFTLADLMSLADGQVWALRGGEEQAMTRDDFEKIAASCD
jgi:hypothetical protein